MTRPHSTPYDGDPTGRGRRKEEDGHKWLQHKAQPHRQGGKLPPKFKVAGNPPPNFYSLHCSLVDIQKHLQ